MRSRNILTEEDVSGALESNVAPVSRAPTADDYWGRLFKYVPVEIIGAYLIVSGVLDTAYQDGSAARQIAMAILGCLGLVASWLFTQRVLQVVRPTQLTMTVFAFAVWVFATGGVFATTGWWQPWMGTIAVVVFGVASRIVGLGSLPESATSP
jgi:drug/metabolite transporter (DMT)-like permease